MVCCCIAHCFATKTMSTTPIKQRATKWNDGDRAKFFNLYKTNKIDIKQTDPKYIYSIRDKYWPGRANKTFSSNWKTSVANIHLEGNLNGARAAAAKNSEEADDVEEEDIDDTKMPASSVDEGLASAFKATSIFRPHSLKSERPYMISTYPKDDKNMCEIELTLGGYVPDDDAVQSFVSEDRNSINISVGTIKKFADLRRKGRQLGANFHVNDVRYNAYGDSVQKVRQNDKEKLKGQHYFDDGQEIILPFPCVCTIVKKKLHHHPVAIHEGHHQFYTWYTLVLEGVERRVSMEYGAHSATYTYQEDEAGPNDSDEEL